MSQVSDAPASEPADQSRLVFRPDPARAARIARVRAVILAGTALCILVAFVLVAAYRPRMTVRASAGEPELPAPVGLRSAPVQASGRRPPAAALGPVARTRLALSRVDSLAARVDDRWLRALQMLPDGAVDRSRADAALGGVLRAGVLLDSAVADADIIRVEVDTILVRSHASGLGSLAYRLSAVGAAAGRYARVLAADARERRECLALTEEALRMLSQDDTDEYDVKQNAANACRYRSRDRQRWLRRLRQQLSEAEQGLH